MTDAQPTCPRPKCGKPIGDTAYVCPRCADVLAVALRHAASLWPDVETAVARESRIVASPNPPGIRRTLHGPYCRTCHHDSCLDVHKSQIAARQEDPITGETNVISFTAHENAWVVANTATTWARLVSEEKSEDIPPEPEPEPKRADPVRVVVHRPKPLHLVPTDRPDRCDYSDLPVESCACGHHERTTA